MILTMTDQHWLKKKATIVTVCPQIMLHKSAQRGGDRGLPRPKRNPLKYSVTEGSETILNQSCATSPAQRKGWAAYSSKMGQILGIFPLCSGFSNFSTRNQILNGKCIFFSLPLSPSSSLSLSSSLFSLSSLLSPLSSLLSPLSSLLSPLSSLLSSSSLSFLLSLSLFFSLSFSSFLLFSSLLLFFLFSLFFFLFFFSFFFSLFSFFVHFLPFFLPCFFRSFLPAFLPSSDSLRTARHLQAQRESRVTTQHLRSCLCQNTYVRSLRVPPVTKVMAEKTEGQVLMERVRSPCERRFFSVQLMLNS